MKWFITGLVVLGCIVTFLTPFTATAASGSVSKLEDAVDVLEELNTIPERGIPPALLANASGIAIIPNVIKAGFIIGGRYGTGILMVRDRDGGWSNPSFISLAGGSIGWQAGVEAIDIILVFKNERNIDRIVGGKFTLGADASISAGPVGRSAEAATDVQLKSEIYSYSRSRGLFAGIALQGAAMQIDEDANERMYGSKGIRARDIFADKELKAPPAAEKLKKLVTEYAGGKQEKGAGRER